MNKEKKFESIEYIEEKVKCEDFVLGKELRASIDVNITVCKIVTICEYVESCKNADAECIMIKTPKSPLSKSRVVFIEKS